MKVIAGDFQEKDGWVFTNLGMIFGRRTSPGAMTFSEKVPLEGNVESVQVVTEDNKKSLMGAAGWGAVGALALGPVGLLAGLLGGGRHKEVVVAVTLKDGRRFLATVDPSTHKRLLALAF